MENAPNDDPMNRWRIPSPGGLPSVDVESHLDRMPTEEELAGHDERTANHIENVARKMRLLNGQILHPLREEEEDLPVPSRTAYWFRLLIEERARNHDNSKRQWPERPIFARIDAKLQDLTYGSDEYDDALGFLGPALDHHYAANSHHPEFYERGVRGMTLMDLGEMACDWAAAIERHGDGHPLQSMDQNRQRFEIPDGLALILTNTLFWLSGQPFPPEAHREVTILGLFWEFIMGQQAGKLRVRRMPVGAGDEAVQQILANTRQAFSLADHNLFPQSDTQ